MSLAAAVESRSARIVRPNDAHVITLDIERLPGRARLQHRGLTIEGEFWDLSGWKSVLGGRRISPNDVIEWPRTICVAWRRYGTKAVKFAAEWDSDREAMLEQVWRVYDEADIIQGHNIARFDTRKLKADWAMMGLKSPRPWKTVDTLAIARREFGFESNTLASLCERMGLPGKVDHYDPECAKMAVAGNKAAQRRLKLYNQGDIEASEALVDYMRGWIPNHPFIGVRGDEKVCNQCGSDSLTLDNSQRYRAVVLDYALYRCDHCGANVRGGWVARAASTRGAR